MNRLVLHYDDKIHELKLTVLLAEHIPLSDATYSRVLWVNNSDSLIKGNDAKIVKFRRKEWCIERDIDALKVRCEINI